MAIFFSSWRARYWSQAHDVVLPPSAHALGAGIRVWAPLSLLVQAELAGRSRTWPSSRTPALPAVTIMLVPQAQTQHMPLTGCKNTCQAEGEAGPDTSGKPAQTWDQPPWKSHLFPQTASESDLSPSSTPVFLQPSHMRQSPSGRHPGSHKQG